MQMGLAIMMGYHSDDCATLYGKDEGISQIQLRFLPWLVWLSGLSTGL